MNNPIEDLGSFMHDQMKGIAGKNIPTTLELGTINGDLSLSVASLGNNIPKGDYMLALHLTLSKMTYDTSSVALTTQSAAGPDSHEHSINAHKHTWTLPTQLRGIKAGDRVLVAWCGTEPVVVDIVVSS